MSARLYYTDSYICQFQAQIIERVQHKNRLAVVLDKSYFYPTSGGQPADRGVLNGTAVLDVSIRPEDGAVLHWMAGELHGDAVTAEIDWPRRFDHMQQHTGQHILSQGFIQVAEAQTVSFHLSDNSVTIDLDTTSLTPAQVNYVEQLANQVVWENRPIEARFVTLEEAQQLPLRKLPPVEYGRIRLVDIANFDLTACGGTHVSRTGGVGLIKIVKIERRNEQARVEFRCGGRALQDYQQKNDVTNTLAAQLTTGIPDLVNGVARLQEENKQAQRLIKKQQAELLQKTAENLLQNGRHLGQTLLICHVMTEGDAAQLRLLANLLTAQNGVVGLLGLAGAKSQLLFCRSADAPGQMNQLLKPALELLGGNGGGNALMAQGGGQSASPEQVQQALEKAASLFLQNI